MSDPHLIVERDAHVVTLTMNRPEARNAMSLEMLARLADAWTMIDADPTIRVAILTGAGGVFSAGADLKAMHGDRSHDPWHARFRDDPDLHWRAFLRHHTLSKPLIAAIEGPALGGGTEILLSTDLRVAGEGARFGLTEARWGLFPLGGSTVRLPRQLSWPHAMELLLTARPVTAERALQMGLVGTLVPDGTALEAARSLAATIASNGPLAVQAILRSAKEARDQPEPAALARELELGWPILGSADAREGAAAFAARRDPVFRSE